MTKQSKRLKRAAAKAPARLRDVAASKALKKKTVHNIRNKGRSLGTFAAASSVRIITSNGDA